MPRHAMHPILALPKGWCLSPCSPCSPATELLPAGNACQPLTCRRLQGCPEGLLEQREGGAGGVQLKTVLPRVGHQNLTS